MGGGAQPTGAELPLVLKRQAPQGVEPVVGAEPAHVVGVVDHHPVSGHPLLEPERIEDLHQISRRRPDRRQVQGRQFFGIRHDRDPPRWCDHLFGAFAGVLWVAVVGDHHFTPCAPVAPGHDVVKRGVTTLNRSTAPSLVTARSDALKVGVGSGRGALWKTRVLLPHWSPRERTIPARARSGDRVPAG
ncbi:MULTISPECIES: hypothetical protein [Amycolatopsis]|uniref:Uncharacterized protein n=1 Tax=Amycolatopsis bullii TaxID=941987 RepID=A0ABQ3JWV4_9PSEU|nr:hypothetical protein [Amycolatopsis bullii]GHF93347.1 hypothetical protein GCM10017567_04980 [Amycolatopsis bullii]